MTHRLGVPTTFECQAFAVPTAVQALQTSSPRTAAAFVIIRDSLAEHFYHVYSIANCLRPIHSRLHLR